MSLLGRLEDLSLPDIIQIVYLSRRTGVLEIINSGRRSTVYFHHGLVVNVCTSDDPDLPSHLAGLGLLTDEDLRRMESQEEVSAGDFAIAMGLLNVIDLAEIVENRIINLAGPLTESKEGEFNFILSEKLDPIEIGYDPDTLFRQGGLSPSRILGTESDKVRPLQGLEESMKAGKALLRGAMASTSSSSLDLGLGAAAFETPAMAESEAIRQEVESWEVPPFPDDQADAELKAPFPEPSDAGAFPDQPADLADEEPIAEAAEPDAEVADAETPQTRVEVSRAAESDAEGRDSAKAAEPQSGEERSFARFRVGSGEEISEQSAEDRNAVILEHDPLFRVAAKRAFSRKQIRVFQFGSVEDVRSSIQDLLDQNRFFVTFLELGERDMEDPEALRLLHHVKKRNRHLPVVVVDADVELRRRHHALEAGADLYLTKPTRSHLQPGLADQTLALFADELTLFADRAFHDWEQLTGTMGEGGEIGRKFYDIAEKEKLNRSLAMVRQLINELSDPDDISQVAETMMRLARDYLDRAILFVATHRHFIEVAGFGPTGDGRDVGSRGTRLKIPRSEPSILRDVAGRERAHVGKIRRTKVNVELIETLGTMQPTEIAVLPIEHEGRVVGLLYGDNAENRSPVGETEGLLLFLGQAAFAFENAVIAKARKKGTDWD